MKNRIYYEARFSTIEIIERWPEWVIAELFTQDSWHNEGKNCYDIVKNSDGLYQMTITIKGDLKIARDCFVTREQCLHDFADQLIINQPALGGHHIYATKIRAAQAIYRYSLKCLNDAKHGLRRIKKIPTKKELKEIFNDLSEKKDYGEKYLQRAAIFFEEIKSDKNNISIDNINEKYRYI